MKGWLVCVGGRFTGPLHSTKEQAERYSTRLTMPSSADSIGVVKANVEVRTQSTVKDRR